MSGKAMQLVGGASSFLKKTLRKITRKMKGKKILAAFVKFQDVNVNIPPRSIVLEESHFYKKINQE